MSGIALRISRLRTALCFLLGLTALLTNLQAQLISPPPPEAITDRQGLPQAFVPAIVQDGQGFIWMATLDGLARYDGRQFKVFLPTLDGRPGLSSAGIENLLTDPRGNLWIKSYQGDLNWFDTRRERIVNVSRQPRYQHYVGRDTLESYYPDRRNRLWVWLRHQGLLCFELNSQRVKRYRHQPNQSGSLAGNSVTAVAEDGRGQIWVATTAGLDRLDEQTNTFVHYRHQPGDLTSLLAAPIRVLHRRQNGDLLLLSERHLTRLDHRSGKMHSVGLPAPTFQWWRHHLGTDRQGNDYLDWSGQILRISRPAAGPGLTLQPLIPPVPNWRSMGLFVDRSDVLWVGTDATGVRKFNLRANLFASQPYRRSFPLDVLTNGLNVAPDQVARLALGSVSYNFRATVDGAGRLWFTVGSTPFYRLDRQTGQITAVSFPAQFRELGSDRPALLATDPGGRVWAVHDSLVCWYDEPRGRWQRFPYPIRQTAQSAGQAGAARSLQYPRPEGAVESPILQVVVDGRALWLMTSGRGLYRVDRQTGQIRRYAHQPGDSTSLSSNNLYSLFADPLDANTLWVGTAGAGLCRFDKRSGRSQRFTTQNGLPNNVIYAAIPDQRGYVWIATNRGLCRLNRQTGRTRTYTREDGLSADEFNRFHSLYLPERGDAKMPGRSTGAVARPHYDDRIILGGIEGVTTFTPGQLEEDTYQPTVELTGLWLNNRLIKPGLHSPLGDEPVQMAQHLTLPHDQNFLTVTFAGLQFNNPGRLRYRYRLEGIDRDWTLTDSPQAIYTDLSPGTYTLRLNAANTLGHWSPHVRTLTVTIEPPWWASWWARLLYIGMAGGLATVVVRGYWRQREARHLRTVAEMKERFFANITHEFRTPLTLLLGPAERIIAESEQAGVRQQGERVLRHGQQLLNLVNQLLDLAKLESATLRVAESRGDLAGFVAEQVGLFGPDADRQRIHLALHNDLEPGEYWFDSGKLTAILANLVGNALKFTPPNGTIDVSLFHPASGGVELVVRDSGVGIAPDQLPHIFERFFQAGDAASPDPVQPERAEAGELSGGQRPMGTGIGLALVKELVGLQGGTITVESTPANKGAKRRGTTFTLTLPYRRATTPPEPDPPTAAPGLPTTHTPTEADARLVAVEVNGADAPVVLVVEDNDDLAAFLADCLPRTYQIHRAADGLDGLEQARERVPDLIISDVMMPGMDGYDLCRRLKADPLTNHVPVMLLTAKAALDSRLEGLRGGADDYLTKPFHVAELQLRVGNLLTTQRRLGEKLRAEFQSPVAAPPAEAVHPFLTTLYGVLDRHLDDTTFGSEELAQQANLSRMQLYRKLKALAGLPASDFIRGYRLKQSLTLLQGGMPVAQAAYAVGFESPSYFSQCFREQFGEPPSRFMARSA